MKEIENRLDKRLDQTESATNCRLADIDKRLVNLESQQPCEPVVIDQLTAKANALEEKFTALENRLENLNRALTERSGSNLPTVEIPRMNIMELNMDRIDQRGLTTP